MENLDPLCTFDCGDNYEFNSVETLSPADRRYWLLTVVGGLFGPQDFPILEEKLAKLYRIAFTRQQAKHLGLSSNATATISGSGSTMERIKRDTSSRRQAPINPTKVVRENIHLNEHVLEFERGYVRRKKRVRKRDLEVANTIATNGSLTFEKSSNYQQILVERRQNRRKVSVKIYNVTHLTEEEVKTNSQQELQESKR